MTKTPAFLLFYTPATKEFVTTENQWEQSLVWEWLSEKRSHCVPPSSRFPQILHLTTTLKGTMSSQPLQPREMSKQNSAAEFNQEAEWTTQTEVYFSFTADVWMRSVKILLCIVSLPFAVICLVFFNSTQELPRPLELICSTIHQWFNSYAKLSTLLFRFVVIVITATLYPSLITLLYPIRWFS